jgi:hypothetical protein
MKLNESFLTVILSLSLIVIFQHKTQGQKLMSVSNELNENGDRFKVGLKGGRVMSKYQFNSYRVTQAKGGWTISKYKSRMFSALEEATSKRKLSYEFVSDKGDTAWVNLIRNMKFEAFNSPGVSIYGGNSSLTIGSYQEVLEDSDNLFGLIETNSLDNQIWNFIVGKKLPSNPGGRITYVGWLTDGERKIKISPVFNYQNPGKKKGMDISLGTQVWLKGFQFFEHGQSIGAVQIGPIDYEVWFSRKNDPMTNFVIGSTFAALIKEFQLDY